MGESPTRRFAVLIDFDPRQCEVVHVEQTPHPDNRAMTNRGCLDRRSIFGRVTQ